MNEVIISPIFYMGNKKKLIAKGLIDLFPKDISTFYDLFAGSSVVSMNTKANKYMVNDINVHLYDLYLMFKVFSEDMIIKHIESRINEYGLATERTSHKTFDDKRVDRYKKAYVNLRDEYNNHKDNILDFYTLMFYSFSQQFRFNRKGDFNMPCGNDCFADSNKPYIKSGCDFFSKQNVEVKNKNYLDFDISEMRENDFVYLDPPYNNTTATYNESGGWSEDSEEKLYQFCEKLNSHKIKFAMSNVFENKGIKNEKLIKWCEKNAWNVYRFGKSSHTACGRGNSNTMEVLIMNYGKNAADGQTFRHE